MANGPKTGAASPEVSSAPRKKAPYYPANSVPRLVSLHFSKNIRSSILYEDKPCDIYLRERHRVGEVKWVKIGEEGGDPLKEQKDDNQQKEEKEQKDQKS